MGDKTVKAQNDISKALELYELAEEEKEALVLGNEEKTEERLSKTNEHGQILMTINSLYESIMKYSEEHNKYFFKPSSIPDVPAHFNVIKSNEESSLKQLDVISEVIQNFQKFVQKLGEEAVDPVLATDASQKMTYYDKIKAEIQNEKWADVQEDFDSFQFKD